MTLCWFDLSHIFVDSRLTALSDAKRSSVEPQYYSTYRELQLRISTIPTFKSTEVVGNLKESRTPMLPLGTERGLTFEMDPLTSPFV